MHPAKHLVFCRRITSIKTLVELKRSIGTQLTSVLQRNWTTKSLKTVKLSKHTLRIFRKDTEVWSQVKLAQQWTVCQRDTHQMRRTSRSWILMEDSTLLFLWETNQARGHYRATRTLWRLETMAMLTLVSKSLLYLLRQPTMEAECWARWGQFLVNLKTTTWARLLKHNQMKKLFKGTWNLCQCSTSLGKSWNPL